MPFFQKGQRTAKSAGQKSKGKNTREGKPKGRKRKLDEIIESDSEIDSDDAEGNGVAGSSDEEQETPEEKKLRLAKLYLEQLSNEVGADEEEEEEDMVGKRLQNNALAQSGKLFKCVADQYTHPDVDKIRKLKGHNLTVTCAVISPDGKTAFSASKDGTVIKWCVETGKRLHVVPGGRKDTEKTHVGHTSCVLCMAISSDGKFLATGDENKLIQVWDPETCKIIHTFRGHRKAVTGLTFRRNFHTLFSTGLDRMIKCWNLDEMSYVESHHGTDMVAIDSLMQECAITVGGREREVLVHNFPMESTRKFYAHTESDCVALINESYFVIGGQDNSLSVWSVNKKKPLCVVRNAHSGPEQSAGVGENWITAVTSLQFSDLVASGSKDGFIRVWKCSSDFHHLTPLFAVPATGFVNSLKFSQKGDMLVAGVGREHRMGRWWSMKTKNEVMVIPLTKNEEKVGK
ncbi:U3 small nucleolar RNA-interacting protein 2-like isoform X2 [Babylonia areolata]|uniref:U3 small nucleolar RNA-interacting protein 2-like isoform X2 n=1 Tax=Babylonia areolata TaxID=304850 RepID=UPI003FCFC733